MYIIEKFNYCLFVTKKKARNESVPCPSGNRGHGWEGKMSSIHILSSENGQIFNYFILNFESICRIYSSSMSKSIEKEAL